MWVIARPKPKLQDSVNFLRANGINICGIAPLDIIDNRQAINHLKHALSSKEPLPSILVTSTEAAQRLRDIWPKRLTANVYCIGERTAKCLDHLPVTLILPDVSTSEGLVAHENLQHIQNQQFMLVKGLGGRTHISSVLTQRGALVSEYDVYERVEIKPAVQTDPIDWSQVDGIVVTSAALACAMVSEFGLKALANKKWLGVSARLAEYLRSLGIEEIYTSDGATDVHLLGWFNRHGRAWT